MRMIRATSLMAVGVLPLLTFLERTTIRLVSLTPDGRPGGWSSHEPKISADGKAVVFRSLSADLVSGLSGVQHDQCFVRDLTQGRTELVSMGAGDQPLDDACASPSISSDGRFVVFETFATNVTAPNAPTPLIPHELVVLRDRRARSTRVLAYDADHSALVPEREVVFFNHSAGYVAGYYPSDIFTYNFRTGTLTNLTNFYTGPVANLTRGMAGWGASPSVWGGWYSTMWRDSSSSPQIVMQQHTPTNLALWASRTSTGALPNGASRNPSTSLFGPVVAFESDAS